MAASGAASGTRALRAGTPSTTAGNGAVVDEAALQELLRALRAAKDGDFTVRLPQRRNTLLGQIGRAALGPGPVPRRRRQRAPRPIASGTSR